MEPTEQWSSGTCPAAVCLCDKHLDPKQLRGRKGLLRLPGYSSSLRRELRQELEAEVPKELYLLSHSQTHT